MHALYIKPNSLAVKRTLLFQTFPVPYFTNFLGLVLKIPNFKNAI